MAFSMRLDPRTEAQIRRLAKGSGRSRAAVVREAMERYAAGEAREAQYARSLFDRLKPFAGVVSTGEELSTGTHARFQAALTRKLRDRRTR